MRNRVYQRQICLHTYEDEEVNYIFCLKIFMPPLNSINLKHHFGLLLLSWLINLLLTLHITSTQEWLRILITVYLFIISAFIGLKITWKNLHLGLLSVASPIALSAFLGIVYLNISQTSFFDRIQLASFITNVLKIFVTLSLGIFLGALSEKFIKFSHQNHQFTWKSLSQPFNRFYLILSLAISSVSAMSFALMFTVEPLMVLIFLASTSLLTLITYHNPIKYYQWLQNYKKRQKQGKLIQP